MPTSTTARLSSMPDVLTVDEAAQILRIARNTAYQAVKRGELPSRRVCGRIIIPRAGLQQLLEQSA